MSSELKEIINRLWEEKNSLNLNDNKLHESINTVLSRLDDGTLRICEKRNGEWITNEWLKKAILLSFR